MWQPWGPCSATCSGQRRRARTCVPPHFGGAPCRGNIVNTQHCGARQCPGIPVFFLKMKYNRWPDDRRIKKKLKIASFDISRYAILKTIYSAFVLYDSKCHKIYKRNLIKIINKPWYIPACNVILLSVDENPPNDILCCISVK